MSRPGRYAHRGECGQALVFWILAFTIILFVAVIAFDVGLWLSEKRNAQKAADLAALAAATKLHDSDAETISLGREFAARNGYDNNDGDVEVVVTPQYNNDPDLVEVTVARDPPIVFLGVFGFVTGDDIEARAVAEVVGSPGGPGVYAIFANRTDCNDPPQLEFPGSNVTVIGQVHSNGDAKVNGSDNNFTGSFTYDCQMDLSGSNNGFNPAHQQTGDEMMPINYSYDDFPCDIEYTQDTDLGSRNEVWVNNDPGTRQLKQLVICSTADLSLSLQGATGTVTLVAGDELKLNGSDFNLTGYWNDVLAYSAAGHDSAIDMSGSNSDWTGYIHAPNGRLKVQGSDNSSLIGSIIADEVIVSGQNFTIDASGFTPGTPVPPNIRLKE